MNHSVLFVAGPGRSGTSAFARYLNQHEQIVVCRERYKFVPREITPDYFTFERILDYREGETNLPQQYHVDLLSKKDPDRVKWVGDKTPSYVRNFRPLLKHNPGAHFVVMYRPIEEVAESYDARSKNPNDSWLGGKNGFELGIRDWNIAMKKTREFIESDLNPNVLIVSYHEFFYRNEACIPLISRFLDLEFDESVRRAWRKTSLGFEQRRREKTPLSEEQLRFVEKNKDHLAEGWILDRIQRQWSEPERLFAAQTREAAPSNGGNGSPVSRSSEVTGGRGKGPRNNARRIENLENRLLEERGKTQSLEQENQRLKLRVRELESQTQVPYLIDGLKHGLSRVGNGVLKKLRR